MVNDQFWNLHSSSHPHVSHQSLSRQPRLYSFPCKADVKPTKWLVTIFLAASLPMMPSIRLLNLSKTCTRYLFYTTNCKSPPLHLKCRKHKPKKAKDHVQIFRLQITKKLQIFIYRLHQHEKFKWLSYNYGSSFWKKYGRVKHASFRDFNSSFVKF